MAFRGTFFHFFSNFFITICFYCKTIFLAKGLKVLPYLPIDYLTGDAHIGVSVVSKKIVYLQEYGPSEFEIIEEFAYDKDGSPVAVDELLNDLWEVVGL